MSAGFNVETVEFKNLTLTIWDLPVELRSKVLPKFFDIYYANTDAVIFVLDCDDFNRFPDASYELHV